MNGKFVRFVAAVVTGGVVSLTAGGMAMASTASVETHAPGAAATTSHTAAAQLQQLHDYLEAAIRGENVGAVIDSIDYLRPVLAAVKTGKVDRASLDYSIRADDLAAEAQRILPGLPLPGGLPDPLSIVTDLLQTLLSTLMDLVGGLLSAAPVPLPPLPELPLPDLPLPDLPVPELPAPEAPESPEAPEAPESPEAPEAPEAPDAPEAPEAPDAPEAPEAPGAPETPDTPEAPEAPDAPLPPAPLP